MAADQHGREVNFDRVADEYDSSRGGAARAEAAAQDLAPHLPAGVALEIGVGTGIVAGALSSHAPRLDRLAGIDISEQMLARASQRLPGRVLLCWRRGFRRAESPRRTACCVPCS